MHLSTHGFRLNNTQTFSGMIGVLLILAWITGAMLPPPEPNLNAAMHAPDWSHWLGTDRLGRDVAIRFLLGFSRTTLRASAALTASCLIGAVMAIGSVLMYRHIGDRLIIGLAEALRAFPTLVLVLLFAAAGVPSTAFLVLYFWIPVWRVLRGELTAQYRQPYALAARLIGMHPAIVLLREVLPNVLPRVLPYAAGLMAEVISVQAALEFLGFGPPLEQPSLGGMLLEATTLGLAAPWVWLPSLAATVLLVWGIAWSVRSRRSQIRWVELG